MVITEKESEGTAEPKTRKKWGKKILIILAVWIGLGGIASFILDSTDDDEAEYTQTKVESTQTQAQSSDISILVYSDIFFGYNKTELTKMLQDKGWTIMGSFKEDEDFLASALEFGIDKEAWFQGQIIYSIVTEFDEDDKLQKFSIFFDVRPELLYYQGFENINQKIEKVTENCILYQGYKEHESLRKDGFRAFSDVNKNITLFHFEESIIEKNHIFIEYYSAELTGKMDIK
ncbi:MAG: hypothetical protein K6E51_06635 [Treponema sp.]|nr:hypothetical protein [Treponema sp.]